MPPQTFYEVSTRTWQSPHKGIADQITKERRAAQIARQAYRENVFKIHQEAVEPFFGSISIPDYENLRRTRFPEIEYEWFEKQFDAIWKAKVSTRLDESFVKRLTGRTREANEIQELRTKISLLEQQLYRDRPHLQLYRLGGTALVVSVLSILMWWFTGVAAPFHPIFAALVAPIAIGVMVMAVFMRPKADEIDGASGD